MMECLMKEGANFSCCHWSLLPIKKCYECPTLLCCFKIWKIWKTSKMSHCYILQNLKRYFGILDRRTMTWFKKKLFWLPYIYIKNIQKNFSLPGNQFCARFFQSFDVTLFKQPFLKMVQNHHFDHNFLIWRRTSNLKHVTYSVGSPWLF